MRSENAGMSSENCVRIVMAEYLRFPGVGSSSLGQPGAKLRPKGVGDGQQVEIPVLQCNRTVGTQRESGTREWKNRGKRGTGMTGKSVIQREDVMRTEIRVGKSMS